jgi:hypothetical protein
MMYQLPYQVIFQTSASGNCSHLEGAVHAALVSDSLYGFHSQVQSLEITERQPKHVSTHM